MDDMVGSCGITSYLMFSAAKYRWRVGAIDMMDLRRSMQSSHPRRPRMAKKLKLQESRVVISSERGLAAHRRLRFFERSVVPIVDRRANGGRRMEWARILAYITGTVDQELLLRNEYLAAENRILRGQLKGRLKFSDAERA